MTIERTITGIYRGAPFHWVGDGFRVSNYFQSGNNFGHRISPFLLLDYHAPFEYPPTDNERRGVGPHPHRGFETVTLAFAGSVAHHDSAGNGGIIGPGDVQWMTAGSGILHREYHEKNFASTGGILHAIQLWVNLPKAHKMDAPHYQGLVATQMGRIDLPDNSGYVRIIAGEYQGATGPAKTYTPMNMFDIHLQPDGRADFSFPAHENTMILVMSGAVIINDKAPATAADFVLFGNAGENITVNAQSAAHLVLLNGEPINEPVVQHGPFVMTTEQEIRKAIDDFNSGKFGELED